MIATWTELEISLGETDQSGDLRSVLKLLNDVYGRAKSTPERRAAIRQQALQEFGRRINTIETRLGA